MDDRFSPGIATDRLPEPASVEAGRENAMARSEAMDDELIRAVVGGNTELFETLMLRHRDHVGRIVSGHVPSDMVPEVAHEVFVKAYTGLATYAFEQPFAHWLSTIAVRACYDFWRTRQGTDLPVSALTAEHQQWMDRVLAAQSDDRFSEQVRRHEATEVLAWALAQLSPENRAVLTLVHLDGHSVREAAQLLGWSLVNVKVRAHRARQALRTILMKEP
jgi:RNA polymerase sigma-70 factor (ECF subfamily)